MIWQTVPLKTLVRNNYLFKVSMQMQHGTFSCCLATMCLKALRLMSVHLLFLLPFMQILFASNSLIRPPKLFEMVKGSLWKNQPPALKGYNSTYSLSAVLSLPLCGVKQRLTAIKKCAESHCVVSLRPKRASRHYFLRLTRYYWNQCLAVKKIDSNDLFSFDVIFNFRHVYGNLLVFVFLGSYLTSLRCLFRNAHDESFWLTPLTVVCTLLLQAECEGPTLISCSRVTAAHYCTAVP